MAACCLTAAASGVDDRNNQQGEAGARSAPSYPKESVLERANEVTSKLDRELDLIAEHMAVGGGAQETPLGVISRRQMASRFATRTPNLGALAHRFLRSGVGARARARAASQGKGIGWGTNDKYKFPYWSSTGRKWGEALNEGTGLCFLGVFPWVKMKRNDLQQSVGGALSEMIGATECKSNDQCDVASETWSCMGQVSTGMSLHPLCYKAKGDNACACGVALDHIRFKEYCKVGDVDKEEVDKGLYPPKFALDPGPDTGLRGKHQLGRFDGPRGRSGDSRWCDRRACAGCLGRVLACETEERSGERSDFRWQESHRQTRRDPAHQPAVGDHGGQRCVPGSRIEQRDVRSGARCVRHGVRGALSGFSDTDKPSGR